MSYTTNNLLNESLAILGDRSRVAKAISKSMLHGKADRDSIFLGLTAMEKAPRNLHNNTVITEGMPANHQQAICDAANCVKRHSEPTIAPDGTGSQGGGM